MAMKKAENNVAQLTDDEILEGFATPTSIL